MGPGDLHALLKSSGLVLPNAAADLALGDVLVGLETGDDAGVVRLDAQQALVTTADFITPPFDDPQGYGRIAAANAISDVYAMGGRPVCAINLCLFPRGLEKEVAAEILAGARAVLAGAGVALVGGHSVYAQELFFGLSVTGVVAPDRIWRNVGAQPGDALILTKPLGTGLLVSGVRRGLLGQSLSPADLQDCAEGMAATNRQAAAVLQGFSVHAATDVTGFALVGHALGMTRAEHPAVRLYIDLDRLPLYPGALALAAAGVTCGGAKNNRAAYRSQLEIDGSLDAAHEELLFDPQTSGGLLVALPAQDSEAALAALHAQGVPAQVIGQVEERGDRPPIVVRAR